MNDKQTLIKYWIKSANEDLIVAEHLFEKEDFTYCLFLGHLVIEKSLKAVYIKNVDNNPPFKHNLPLLAEKAKINLTEEQETFLEEVTDFNIEARYPDIKFSFKKQCNKNFTKKYFDQIKEFYIWIKQTLN